MSKKGKIIIAGVALFICVGMLVIMIGTTQIESEEDGTVELSAVLSYVEISSTSQSTYVKLITKEPELTLFIPPYVIEYLDMSLLNELIPECMIRFRIDTKDEDALPTGYSPVVYSLSTEGKSVFTLSEHNAYMHMYMKPLTITAAIVFGLSLCTFVACMISTLRRRS